MKPIEQQPKIKKKISIAEYSPTKWDLQLLIFHEKRICDYLAWALYVMGTIVPPNFSSADKLKFYRLQSEKLAEISRLSQVHYQQIAVLSKIRKVGVA